jgi:hypothetical protein
LFYLDNTDWFSGEVICCVATECKDENESLVQRPPGEKEEREGERERERGGEGERERERRGDTRKNSKVVKIPPCTCTYMHSYTVGIAKSN